jgi:hypothetical protein
VTSTYLANVRRFASRNRSISNPYYVELDGDLVEDIWLSDIDVECLNMHVLKYVRGLKDGGNHIRGFRRDMERSNQVWIELSSFESGAVEACNKLESLGINCDMYTKRMRGFSDRRTTIPVPVRYESMVSSDEFKAKIVDELQPFVSACDEVDRALVTPGTSPIGPWTDFCGKVYNAMEKQKQVAEASGQTCGGNQQCAEAMEVVRNLPDLHSVVQCLLGDSTDPGGVSQRAHGGTDIITYCVWANGVLKEAASEGRAYTPNAQLEPLLPILTNQFFKATLQIEPDLTQGCIVGGGRFVSDQSGACSKMTRHLASLADVTLQRGCNQGNLEVCRALIQASESIGGPELSLTTKLGYLSASCAESGGYCTGYLRMIPQQHVCFSSHYDWRANATVWDDRLWKPLLPEIEAQTKSLCANHPDRAVARRACTVASQAELGQGIFTTNCGQLRVKRQKRLNQRAERYQKCAQENGASIARAYRGCAGLSYGSGNTMDQACQMQAQNSHCR